MEGEVNVKVIEHFSGLLYGNHLGTPVNHVIHRRGGTRFFSSAPFLSKLSLTQSQLFNEKESLLSHF